MFSPPSFEILVRAHSGELYRFAYWLCRDRSLAEDLVQETFARAFKGWTGLRDDKAVRAWLYVILRHEHARLFEKKTVEIDPVDLDDINIGIDANTQQALEMEEALRALPDGYREPLLLQVLGGFTCREIGQILDLPEAAVMTRLSRARKALRRLVECPGDSREARR